MLDLLKDCVGISEPEQIVLIVPIEMCSIKLTSVSLTQMKLRKKQHGHFLRVVLKNRYNLDCLFSIYNACFLNYKNSQHAVKQGVIRLWYNEVSQSFKLPQD